MSGTHAVITSSASVDGTAGTFVELATNSPIPLQDGSKKFHGVVFSGAPLAQVAAKPASLRIKLTSSSLDIVGEIFTYGAGYGGGIATNDQQPYFPIDFLQFDVAAAGGEILGARPVREQLVELDLEGAEEHPQAGLPVDVRPDRDLAARDRQEDVGLVDVLDLSHGSPSGVSVQRPSPAAPGRSPSPRRCSGRRPARGPPGTL